MDTSLLDAVDEQTGDLLAAARNLLQVARDAQDRNERSLADLAAIVADMQAWCSAQAPLPKFGDLLELDQIPVNSYIRLAGEDVMYLGYVGSVMHYRPVGADWTAEYPVGDGETFAWVGDPF